MERRGGDERESVGEQPPAGTPRKGYSCPSLGKALRLKHQSPRSSISGEGQAPIARTLRGSCVAGLSQNTRPCGVGVPAAPGKSSVRPLALDGHHPP